MLNQKRLTELLHYDPDTGIFTWKISVCSRAKAGSIAGSFTSGGYRRIGIDGVDYKTSRLAWFYVYGRWPQYHIDHLDHDRTNDRISNLRDIPNKMNIENQIRAHKNNKTSGLLGVHFATREQKYIAKIRVGKKRIHLGMFGTPEAAHEAYVKAKRRLHEGNTL